MRHNQGVNREPAAALSSFHNETLDTLPITPRQRWEFGHPRSVKALHVLRSILLAGLVFAAGYAVGGLT